MASDPNERYTHGTSEGMQAVMNRRRASEWAAFFVPHLKPGMRLLDCGCGPGSITADLANLVAPAEAVGIDLDPRQFINARAIAAERGATNLSFVEASVYQLPFPDAHFDAVFAHTVIQHLRDPLRALREMRRVLKPGGLAGVRDEDWGTLLWEPSTPLLRSYIELLLKIWEHNGGQPFYPRHLRELFREAGFQRTEGHASARWFGTREAATWGVANGFLGNQLKASEFVDVAIAQGWADRETLAAMERDVQAWCAREDGFWAILFCAVVGWA
jgi:ubiquinone/menaquinone biosynthesis C-methylase UbiE